ncbi:MAG: prepilin-type N-terminal cleavage/methylation domain-containing protein [Synergistaceae bacterium]|jgi:type II secretory pathway pseudopilin PulG|nr:prepilin-type N-terminal cleavage/methylation domain-containing protein [Synergistaceae bacterium]
MRDKRDQTQGYRENLQGFTLIEILVATMVSTLVLGAIILLMGQGLNLVGSNTAYTVAQRSALSTIEFMPKEIAYASQVEIISNPAHVITDNLLSEDWHYIVRATDKVHHLYWDKGRKEEAILGSEFVTDLKFDADIFSPDQYGGGRVLLFHVETENNKKNVALNRARLVHTLEGVMGEDNVSIDATFTGGPILRYRTILVKDNSEVDLFGSLNTDDDAVHFDYTKPDTWDRVKHYTPVTKIDATLNLSREVHNRLDPMEPPVFTWIVAQTELFFSKYPELSGDLFDRLEKTEKQEKLLRVLKADSYLKNHLNDRTVDKKATKDPSQIKEKPFEQGYRVLEVSRGKQINADTYGTEFYLHLGGIINTMLRQPGDYQGALLISIAHYKDKDGTWNMAPAFATLGEDQSSGNLWERVMDIVNKRGTFGGGMLNEHIHFGKIVPALDQSTGRWTFTAYGGYNARRRGPQILLTLTDEDFQHLKPKDSSKPNLYGVTNYTLYLEGQLAYTKSKALDGGYGVLLNGTTPQTVQVGIDKVNEYLSSGYMFQLDPGAGGYLMRYAYYKEANLNQVSLLANEENRLNVYDHDVGVTFGVHPLYAYDASKSYHGKPRTNEAPQVVNFFTTSNSADLTVLSEDLNKHVGVLNPEQRIYYRLPFMPPSENGGGSEPYYTRESVLRTFTRGRDKIGLSHYVDYGGPYGMTYGGSSRSVYNPKHMQTWQLYYKESDVNGTHDPETKVTMDFPYKNDTRKGYRWDMREIKDGASKGVPIVWRTRHLVKLTVLEITRDILASEVEEDWRSRIHHDGSTDMTYDPKDIIHQAGDLFVRLEMVQVKNIDDNVANDINDSRQYYYSKPIWFGKFRGDYWRGDSPSLFKKMGNNMAHTVSPPEPKGGDRKTFQRRGMRIRSWKDNFVGWDFENPNHASGTYTWKDDLIGKKPRHPDLTLGNDTVWTPPIAIDLKGYGVQGDWGNHGQHPKIQNEWQNPEHSQFGHNSVGANGEVGTNNKGFTNDVHSNYQWGDRRGDTYGNYAFVGQKVKFERREKGNNPSYVYAYNGYYDDKIYGRLSIQRHYGVSTPLYGLYALRGWDYLLQDFTSASGPTYDFNGLSYADVAGKRFSYPNKRFLMVVQGLQMSYQPSRIDLKGDFVQPNLNAGSINYYRRAPAGTPDVVFRKDRVRTLGFRFWSGPGGKTMIGANLNNPNQFKFYDMWFDEGFTPKEVRTILGLDPKQFTDSTLDTEIPKLYETQ